MIELKIRKLRETATLPKQMSDSAAGFDLTADLTEHVTIKPGEVALVPTGLAMSIPHGYEGQVRPRSGLAFKYGIGVLNSPGTIDADYRGEVKVILFNFSNTKFVVENGMRIAQIVFNQITPISIKVVEELDETERGDGGFGHTKLK